MSLDEAIAHCEEKAKTCDACGLEHKQLAEWLKELKSAREELERKTRILDKIPWDMVIDAENEVDDEDGIPEEDRT